MQRLETCNPDAKPLARLRLEACLLTLLFLMLHATPTLAQDNTEDVNELCISHAQTVVSLELPYIHEDSLEADPLASRVDFYRFHAEPGLVVNVNLRGQLESSGEQLDPYLGVFNAACQLLQSNDDFNSTDSFLQVIVPEDGQFVIAAARFNDYQFDGTEQSSTGSVYTLSLELAAPSIGSISTRLTNSLTGAPLSGDREPYASVELYGCDSDCNTYISALNANSDGVVRFNGMDYYPNLSAGTYLIRARADDFTPNESGRFTISEGRDVNIGDIPMAPPSIAFGDFTACDDILPQGGVCTYDVEVDNNTNGELNALVWSHVEAYNLASPESYTRFEASSAGPSDDNALRANISTAALSSSLVSFSFEVPSFAPEGAEFCQSAFIGLYPDPLFNTFKQQYLFCVVKSPTGYQKLTGPGMAKANVRQSNKLIDRQLLSQGISPLD